MARFFAVNWAVAVGALAVVAIAFPAFAQRGPKAVLQGSYEAEVADNNARLAYEGSICEKHGHLLSPPEKKNGKSEAVADPKFFLLPQRAQLVLLKRRNPKDTISIVFFGENGGKLSAGTFKDIKNDRGLHITPGRAKTAISLLDKQEAEEFAASVKPKTDE